LGIEGVIESCNFIKDTPQTPDIRLLVIGFLLADLRRQVIWRPNSCIGAVVRMLEYSSNSEISDFNIALLRQEYILSFEISMQNLLVMHIVHRKSHLDKPCDNL
jgi:hypothetical protein